MIANILIVDDEPSILNSIKKQFEENDFKMFFALSAKEGFEILEKESIDIVISDIKMPQINGIDFLKAVKDKYPSVNRIMISGHMPYDKLIKLISSGVGSSYIIKPWSYEQLYGILLSIVKYRKILKNKEIISLFNSIEQLPSSPATYLKFIEAIQHGFSASEIAEVISKDASISTLLLHIANSVHYCNIKAETIEKAVVTLGIALIKDILFIAEIAKNIPTDKKNELYKIINSSIVTGYLIEKLYTFKNNHNLPKEYEAIGITHKIGLIMLLDLFPDKYFAIQKEKKSDPSKSYKQIEKELGFEVGYPEMGAYLLNMWNVPDILVYSSLYHHIDDKSFHSSIVKILQTSVYITECLEYNIPIEYNLLPETFILKENIKEIVAQTKDKFFKD